ncbi:MAG TPA: hypothetical protein VKC56_11205 [Gallionellaceae bacterium]|nr:hypothetical protein [Gallionellaceae bacterium]
MALWQFQIEFIPRAWLEAVAGDLSPLFGDDGRDMAPAWRAHPPALPVDALFTAMLPPAPGRYAGELYWGDEKHSDAHVWHDNGQVESIGVRVDARNYSARLLQQIAEIAGQLHCDLLIPETRTVIAPNVFALHSALRASKAARYVQGPRKYPERNTDNRREDGSAEDGMGDDGPGKGPDVA